VAAIYKGKDRWGIELVFAGFKQHLWIKAFYGTSENKVKTQIWIAISVCLLIAIVKKRLDLPGSFYTLLQVLSATLLERMTFHRCPPEGPPMFRFSQKRRLSNRSRLH
jgi:IS4 transposase